MEEIGNISIDFAIQYTTRTVEIWKKLNELCRQPIIRDRPNVHILIFQLIFLRSVRCIARMGWLTRGSGVFDNIDVAFETTTAIECAKNVMHFKRANFQSAFSGYLFSILESLWAKCTCESIYILRTKSIVCGFAFIRCV